MVLTQSLLRTKLFIPNLRDKLVTRQNIIEQLDKGLDYKLTLISAPAGFGKTTILTQWIHQSKKKVAWLSLDKEDNNLNRFLTYMVTALQTIEPKIGKETVSILALPQTQQIENILAILINEVISSAKEYILILDDYHFIELKGIHEAVAFLLNNSPANFHIFITSRFESFDLPIARLRARFELQEINAAKLRFTSTDIITFFHKMGLKLSPEEADLIGQKTEGWVLSLQLASLSMQEADNIRTFINEFTGNNRFIVDYLLDEILNTLSESVQRFLFETSLLAKFNAGLCNQLTERSNSQELIDELERKNLFLVPLDNKRVWYRYHNLFSELLYHRLQKEKADLIPGLHLRVSKWFAENGLITEAVHHAILSGDKMQLASLVEKAGYKMVFLGEISLLESWYEKLPEEIIISSPKLAAYYAWTLTLTYKLEQAKKILRKIEQIDYPIEKLVYENCNFPLKSQMANIRATIARRTGDVANIIKYSQEALEEIKGTDIFILATAYFNLGIAYMISGSFAESITELTKSITYNKKVGNLITVLASIVCKARILMLQGHLFEAEKLYRQALKEAENYKLSKHSLIGTVLLDLATINYYWDNLDLVKTYLTEGINLTKNAYNSDSIYGYNSLLEIKLALKDTENAEEAIFEVEQFASEKKLSSTLDKVKAFQANLWLIQGRLESVESWAKKFSFSLRSQDVEIFVYLRWLIIKNKYGEAMEILEKLFVKTKAEGLRENIIKILILQALILQKMNDPQKAFSALKEALVMAAPQEYIRTFADEDKNIFPLIIQALEELEKEKITISDNFTNKLFRALGIEPDKSPSILSEREIEIIKLIEAGLSNQDIAERVFVSMNTVKTHIKNIYRKLEVQNRTQALMQAKRLEII